MPLPQLDFLLESSMRSLEDLELSSLNRAANLSKAVRTELDDWIEERAKAMLSRWMIQHRDALVFPEIKPKQVELFEAETKKRA
jgi:hypothetical protein